MLSEEIKNIRSTKVDLRKFGITIGIVFLILGVILLYYENSLYYYFIGSGGVLILMGILFPILLLHFQKIWMTFAVILGFIMTRIILGILFYFIMTPIKLIAKLFGNNFLDINFEKDKISYWNKRDLKKFNPLDSEKQF